MLSSLSVLGIRDVETKQYGVASGLTNTSYFLGAGIGLSLMTQFFPSYPAVSILSLTILFVYGVILLSFFITKEHKTIRTSVHY